MGNHRRTLSLGLAVAAAIGGCSVPRTAGLVSPPPTRGAEIVLRAAGAQNPDAFAAGKAAAEALRKQMGATVPHVVLLAEYFEDEALKRQALQGVCSVFPRDIVLGGATYGSFSQSGCLDRQSVGLLGIGGGGIATAAAIEPQLVAKVHLRDEARLSPDKDKAEIETRLHQAGERLARQLPRSPNDRLLILMADAHSPKNQFLVDGVQAVMGKEFPITGGSANKNAGQTFVYFRGQMFRDSAVALLLSGDFAVSLAGRQAKENEKVISTARDAAAEALKSLRGKPIAALAFDCAGRKGKLQKTADELAAIQQAIPKDLPLFGCYCAGEIGPADVSEKTPGVLSSGVGWHVMFTVLGRE